MAMAASVIVTGAMAAHEPVIVIHGYYVYVRHQFIAIFAIGIIVVAAIFTDIIAITYMVLSSP
jgi:triacylglycerol esterase/lipase EstA (alpha/beta hydrolase family)